jgi:hypothetical protein
MKKALNKKIIDSVAQVLLQHSRPEDAISLIELCGLAAVRATDAFLAINHLSNAGFKIRLTDELPRKFYCEKNGDKNL